MKLSHSLGFLSLLSACAGDVAPVVTPQPPAVLDFGQIETAADGRCFGHDVAPAVIETVTEQILVTPEQRGANGAVTVPATFRTITRQQIIRERAELRFETLCPPQYTPELVATLQRALKARGVYPGPINGALDGATSQAIQRFQRRAGHDSPLLDIRTARDLGIVALSQAQLDG